MLTHKTHTYWLRPCASATNGLRKSVVINDFLQCIAMYHIVAEAQGRSQYVYVLCVSTRHSILKKGMSKYENRMLMYVLALSDFKLLACLWAANAGT